MIGVRVQAGPDPLFDIVETVAVAFGSVAEVVGIRRRGISENIKVIVSGSEVNRLSGELGIEGSPAVDLSQDDLPGGQQSPEQHGGRFG